MYDCPLTAPQDSSSPQTKHAIVGRFSMHTPSQCMSTIAKSPPKGERGLPVVYKIFVSQKVIEEHYSLAGQPFSVYTRPSDRISTYASYPWSSRYRPSCCRRHQCWLPRQQLYQSQTEHEEERFPIKWWYPSLQNSGIHLQAPRGWSPSGCSWSSPRPWVSLGSGLFCLGMGSFAEKPPLLWDATVAPH